MNHFTYNAQFLKLDSKIHQQCLQEQILLAKIENLTTSKHPTSYTACGKNDFFFFCNFKLGVMLLNGYKKEKKVKCNVLFS